jgi:hypothetical protein
MANSLVIPPYRAALLTNADGSPMSANGDGSMIATERQWYMFWRGVADQINAGAQAISDLNGLITFGNHADRPDPGFATDGALYVEQDRGSVLYQNQGGVWQYIAGIMYGTLTPDQRPADLNAAQDVGFQFRTNVDPARAFTWSGADWIETTPIRYGTHAARLAETIANLVSGMLWMETDRGSVIYQNQAGTWLYLAGTMWDTMSPDHRPTDLGVHDAGFDYRSTDPPPREFIWNQTAWVETTTAAGSTTQIAYATATLPLTTTAQPVPGCSLTLARAGTYLVIGVFDFSASLDANIPFLGTLNGQSKYAIFSTPSPEGRVTLGQQWKITVSAGAIINLVVNKTGGTGASFTDTHCSISATWISP